MLWRNHGRSGHTGLSPAEAAGYVRRGRGRRGRPSKGWGSLSPAGRDVASLVTEDLTNAEVGERLFISPRTVGAHLHHAYAKLGVSSRRELARVVKEQVVQTG